jgi:nitrite reductase (NADH) large subunit
MGERRMARRYLVVGAGVAGVTACQSIRDNDPEGDIRLFTDESYPFYSRMRLPEVVSSKVEPERLVLRGPAWLEERGIRFHPGEKIEGIRLDPLTVISARGQYRADKLLLATGGYSFVPPIHGAGLGGVFCLRTMADALQIRDQAQQATKALVIGGGVLGLELGNALRARGLEVTVVEVFDRLLPRQTDPGAASILQKTMEQMGFRFRLGVRPVEIRGDGKRARAVLLQDGQSLEGDMFLISAGVRPRLELAKAVGLTMDKAVVVNDRMETSIQDIYAAGDCVQHRGLYYGIWPAAEQQGLVAGTNMAGAEASYTGTLMSNQLKVLGIDLLAAGETDPEGSLEAELVCDPPRGVYRKIVYKDDRIVGTILLGDISGHKKILRALEEGRSLGSLKGSVLRDPDALGD